MEKKRKSGALAAGLNLLLPGVGYMYCGKILVGIVALLLVVGILFVSPASAIPIWAY